MNDLEFKVNDVKRDEKWSYSIISLSGIGKDLILVNVYGPNTDNPEFYQNLTDVIKQYQNHNMIAVGGWNMVMDAY